MAKMMSTALSSWRWRIGALVVLVVAAIAAGFLFNESMSDSYSQVRDDLLSALGLGFAPVGVWLLVFVWALARRRSWLHLVNVWVGSIAFVALTLGLLGFFQPDDGWLTNFTLDGEVALGGDVGDALAGSTAWQGVLQLLAISAVGLAIFSPPVAAGAAVWAGRAAVLAYVGLILAGRAIGQMYRSNRGAPDATPQRDLTQEAPRAGARRTGAPIPSSLSWKPPATEPEPLLPASTSPIEVAASMDSGPRLEDEAPFEAEAPRAAQETAHAEPVPGDPVDPTPGGKFNRLWDSFRKDESSDAPTSVAVKEPQPPAINRGSPENGSPMVRPLAHSWKLPSTDLLEDVPEGGVSDEEVASTAETIRNTLAEYSVEVEIGQVKPGPTVTMYGLTPGWVRRFKQVKVKDEDGRPKLDESGKQVVVREENKTRVKVDSILGREKDLALALKTPSIRIETPVMGESLVGIEVPNPNPSLVTLRSVMESDEFKRARSKAQLPVALGRGSGGERVVIDLATMPHLLIAGATGAGKSACLNSIISCLIIEKSPAEVRLLLIDPKRVELTPYNGIPHLLTPVVVETDQVVGLLKGLIREMLDRYRRMEELGVRNIASYNQRAPEKMPLLLVVIDELADLMMSAAFDVEQSLCRLAQLGRATGIHLVVATQRPSVDVVTGLIKANFPSRISFAVTSHIDSRTILDSAGADKLLGRGDMLYLPLDASRPQRTQGVFISDSEVEGLVGHWQKTPWAGLAKLELHVPEEDQAEGQDGRSVDDERDELLDKAIELAHTYSKLSTSLLQRRMRIGYPRAARLMDQLEDQGIVGPSDGSKSRDVIMG